MSKIKSINEYSARLLEISQLINPHHGSRGDSNLVKTQKNKGPVPQLNDEAGKNIESVRVKLLDGKAISQVELNLIHNALASWHQSRRANNKIASITFNILSGVISVGLFHIGYLIAKWFNKSLPANPSKEIFKVFGSYKAMLNVEKFLNETKGFKVRMPSQSFSAVTQVLGKSNEVYLSNFPVDTAELDEIFAEIPRGNNSKETIANKAVETQGLTEPDYDKDLNLQESFEFNAYL